MRIRIHKFRLACIVYLVRSVVAAVHHGDPFSPQNAVNIRRMGYLVLLVGFLRPAAEYLAAQAILKQLTIVKSELSLPSPSRLRSSWPACSFWCSPRSGATA